MDSPHGQHVFKLEHAATPVFQNSSSLVAILLAPLLVSGPALPRVAAVKRSQRRCQPTNRLSKHFEADQQQAKARDDAAAEEVQKDKQRHWRVSDEQWNVSIADL